MPRGFFCEGSLLIRQSLRSCQPLASHSIIARVSSGFNQNVSYKGKRLHLQTEDGGAVSACVTSMLFLDGAVVESRKLDYSSLPDDSDRERKIQRIMKKQHRSVLEDLASGAFDEKLGIAGQ